MAASSLASLSPWQKTIIWLIGNSAFGIAPLLLMYFLKLFPLKPENATEASNEINHLLINGLLFFVCVAITGSVFVDILISKLKNSFSTITYLVLVISPFVVIAFVLLLYTLLVFKIVDESVFSSRSWLNVSVVIYSVIYCIIAKLRMFALEA